MALIAPVPSGLPTPVVPSLDHLEQLLPGAFAIAIMVFLETLAVGLVLGMLPAVLVGVLLTLLLVLVELDRVGVTELQPTHDGQDLRAAGELGDRGVSLWMAALPPNALLTARQTPRWAELDQADRLYPTALAVVRAFRAR